ncbi:F-box domain [Macleaya cordata]|uniref:F-box domain n=1 Tax=Macleaya cordata TaxID=56857 RepID=A0A200R2C5_MACCD|nr:F-box domain [Macleaya cordata]
MISELPDPVLHQILSFLPTKLAARTCILSRRWRHLFATTPYLDFLHWRAHATGDSVLETTRFMKFMDRVFFRCGQSKIQNFALECDLDCDVSRFSRWISAAILREVEELNLRIELQQDLIPPSLFRCKSLIKLRIELRYADLNLPQSIFFPKLKILQLVSIKFTDANLTESFFRNCPVLEDLRISDCTWLNMETICISAPALKRLFINGLNTMVDHGLDNCKVKIQAPNLVSLTYRAITFTIEKFPSIARRNDMCQSVNVLLRQLSDVKSLIVCAEAVEGFSPVTLVQMRRMVKKYLSLNLKSIQLKEFSGSQREMEWIELFLKNARGLEKMTIRCSSHLHVDWQAQLYPLKRVSGYYPLVRLFINSSTSEHQRHEHNLTIAVITTTSPPPPPSPTNHRQASPPLIITTTTATTTTFNALTPPPQPLLPLEVQNFEVVMFRGDALTLEHCAPTLNLSNQSASRSGNESESGKMFLVLKYLQSRCGSVGA